MRKLYASITELIENELDTNEHEITRLLIRKLQRVKKLGYLTKEEFVRIGMWKSPRQKRKYLSNSEHRIMQVSKKVFATKFEKRRIDLLTRLNGVSIPTASAILTLTDPKNYGVIDIRVWKVLFAYRSVKVKATGTNFNFRNWYNYLMKLRYYAKKFKVNARDIERTLFRHHKKNNKGLLYKKYERLARLADKQ